jgi:hypothetical protein
MDCYICGKTGMVPDVYCPSDLPDPCKFIFPIHLNFWYRLATEGDNIVLFERHPLRWWKWKKHSIPIDKAKRSAKV